MRTYSNRVSLAQLAMFLDRSEDRPTALTSEHAHLFRDICNERVRQIEKWGDTSHPSTPWDVAGIEPNMVLVEKQIAEQFERAAKEDCAANFKAGRGTWWHLAHEELAEALAARDEKHRRAELVQLAAVVVAWIEDIDRKATA